MAHSSFRDVPFFEEGKCSCASFWGCLSGAQAIAKALRLPPLLHDEANHGKGIRKAKYATIDCNERTIATASDRNIATIVTIAITPTIVAHDAHEDKRGMRRLHATINFTFGALVSRESTQRREWGATSVLTWRES